MEIKLEKVQESEQEGEGKEKVENKKKRRKGEASISEEGRVGEAGGGGR